MTLVKGNRPGIVKARQLMNEPLIQTIASTSMTSVDRLKL